MYVIECERDGTVMVGELQGLVMLFSLAPSEPGEAWLSDGWPGAGDYRVVLEDWHGDAEINRCSPAVWLAAALREETYGVVTRQHEAPFHSFRWFARTDHDHWTVSEWTECRQACDLDDGGVRSQILVVDGLPAIGAPMVACARQHARPDGVGVIYHKADDRPAWFAVLPVPCDRDAVGVVRCDGLAVGVLTSPGVIGTPAGATIDVLPRVDDGRARVVALGVLARAISPFEDRPEWTAWVRSGDAWTTTQPSRREIAGLARCGVPSGHTLVEGDPYWPCVQSAWPALGAAMVRSPGPTEVPDRSETSLPF